MMTVNTLYETFANGRPVKLAKKTRDFQRFAPVYLELQQHLLARVREVIQSKYEIELGPIAIEQPPDVKLGEFALPVAFELARKLRKAPKIIATELAATLNAMQEEFASHFS